MSLEDFSIDTLPSAEDDRFEFKSGRTTNDKLRDKLANAVSAFSNSGGGWFVVGVDDSGHPDVGLSETIGRQPLRDWADQVIHLIQPSPNANVVVQEHPSGNGLLLAVGLTGGHELPYMSPDKKYYIRAGAHTVAASHFIVEALRARRHRDSPRLTHTIRERPDNSFIIQIGVVALTPSPSLDVAISIDPPPSIFQRCKQTFPIVRQLVDFANPFYFDVMTQRDVGDGRGRDMNLSLEYRDLNGKQYVYHAPIDAERSTSPIQVGENPLRSIAKSLEEVARSLNSLLKNGIPGAMFRRLVVGMV
ncbi:MAG: ATP-binding protein [Planctomycetaceae bacterium]